MADFNEEYYTEEEKRRAKRHNRRVDVIAMIFCLIAAIAIWLFAFSREAHPDEKPDTPKDTEQSVVYEDAFSDVDI